MHQILSSGAKRNPLTLACGFSGTAFARCTGLAGNRPSGTVLRVLASLRGGWEIGSIISNSSAENSKRVEVSMTVHRQLNVEDWMGILRRRKWQIITPAILCALGGLFISFVLPKQYTSHTRVLVEAPIVPDDIVKPVVSDDVNRRLASMQGEILSRTHLQGLIRTESSLSK